jgi:2'-5' RNA ligase
MFVALRPPEAALIHLEEFLAPRRDAGELRWVLPDQLHVTLAFLPSVPERVEDDLLDRVARAAGRRHEIRGRLTGGGAFPGVPNARVLWAGLDLDETAGVELDRLATGVRAAAGRAGVAVDGGRFRPHVTLGRFRAPGDATRWVRLLATYAGPRWLVDRITLVESFLGQGPGGRPRYETVETIALGDPPG